MKASVYIASSLDGFIARENGDIDWLMEMDNADPSEDYGYKKFIDTVDVLVMGRHSYEKVLTFGQWPYGSLKVVVLSTKGVKIAKDISGLVSSTTGIPEEIVGKLESQGVKHIYIDGGKTIQKFLRAGLITNMIITRVPILLGKGIPLFGQLQKDVRLKHIQTRTFQSGLVQSNYHVIKYFSS